MKKNVLIGLFVIYALAIAILIYRQSRPIINQQISAMKLTSPAFQNNQKIPVKFTCQGQGDSPELNISDVPEGTESLAIILKDPDAPAGTFIHWLVWNISPNTTVIPENTVPDGSTQGLSSAGKSSYVSPCPHVGQHHYTYNLYALDTTLTLPPQATSVDVERVIAGHILGATTLTGLFP